MAEKELAREQVMALLADGPARITAAVVGLTHVQLHAAPGAGEWSANEVLAHLRACADIWGECIRVILAQNHPTIRAVNPRTWIAHTDYLQQEFGPSLRAFAEQRAGLLAILEPLTPNAWSRGATVTGAGRTLERTVHSYAQWLASHERPHLKQIERIAAQLPGGMRHSA